MHNPQPSSDSGYLEVRQGFQGIMDTSMQGGGRDHKIIKQKFQYNPPLPAIDKRDEIVYFNAIPLFDGIPISDETVWLDFLITGVHLRDLRNDGQTFRLSHTRINSNIYTPPATNVKLYTDLTAEDQATVQLDHEFTTTEQKRLLKKLYTSNYVYFNNKFYLSYPHRPIYSIGPINRTNTDKKGINQYADWTTDAGQKIAGLTSEAWAIQGVTEPNAKQKWLDVNRFTLFADTMLIAYGDDATFYSYNATKSNSAGKLTFDAFDIRTIAEGVMNQASLKIFTIIAHKIPTRNDDFKSVLLVVTSSFHLLVLERIVQNSIATWRRVYNDTLPSPMLGPDAYTQTTTSDLFVVLKTGIHSVNAIIKGEPRDAGRFANLDVFRGTEWATLHYSATHNKYFLECFKLELGTLRPVSVAWSAHAGTLAWSRLMVPTVDDIGTQDDILSQQLQELQGMWRTPLFVRSDHARPITLLRDDTTDTVALSANCLLYHKNNVSEVRGNVDIVPDYLESPRLRMKQVEYLFFTQNLFSLIQQPILLQDIKYISNVAECDIEYYINRSPYTWPYKSSMKNKVRIEMKYGDLYFSDNRTVLPNSTNIHSNTMAKMINFHINKLRTKDFYVIISGRVSTPHIIKSVYMEYLAQEGRERLNSG